MAASQAKRRVRFTTAAALVNELVKQRRTGKVRRLMSRWQEISTDPRWMKWATCLPLADIGAEFLFQVISDRAERAALIITTNLPFSE